MPAIDYLNALEAKEAQKALQHCCGVTRWVEQMIDKRPFADNKTLFETADEIWWGLTDADWREGFSQHPKIGDINTLRAKLSNTKNLSAHEQVNVRIASEAVLQRLARGNQLYEEKFGYIFIVNATGKSATEMLNLLEQRLSNDAQTEIKIAAEEKRKITRIRLEKLLKKLASLQNEQ